MSATKNKSTKSSKPAPSSAPPAEPTVLGVVPKGELREIPLDSIGDPPGTPDRIARPGDDERIAEMARSLREVGQLQPIMVEEAPSPASPKFIRVFGRRRLAAARFNQKHHGGKGTILAIVVPPLAADVRRTIVAVENVQRQDLTPAEEHIAVYELLELQALTAAVQLRISLAPHCGAYSGKLIDERIAEDLSDASPQLQAAARHDMLLDHRVKARACELVAAMLAKTPVWVRDRMYVGRLGEKSRRLVLEGKLPLAHAREIAKVADPEIREDLARSFAAGGDESISDLEPGHLEDLQDEVRSRVFNLKVVPWRLDAPVGKLPACQGCPHNSATNPGLFEHGGEVSDTMVGGVGRRDWTGRSPRDLPGAVCTMHTCYGEKLRATNGAIGAAAKRIVDGGKKPSEAKVPGFIDPAALDKKVRARRETVKSSSRSNSSPREKKTEVPYDERPEYKAKQKYDRDLEAWAEPAKKQVRKLCKGDPILAISLELLFVHSAVQDVKLDINYYGKEIKPKRSLTPAECSNLVAAAYPIKTIAQLEALAKKARDSDDTFSLDGPWDEIEDYVGVFEEVCSVLKVPLKGPRPVFREYVDAEAAKGKKAAPADEKSKATKKAGTKKPAVKDVGDLEEDVP